MACNLAGYMNKSDHSSNNYKATEKQTIKIQPEIILDPINVPRPTIITNYQDTIQQRVSDDVENVKRHILTPILTGDSIKDSRNYHIIEPQFDRTNVQPGMAFIPLIMRDVKPVNISFTGLKIKDDHSFNYQKYLEELRNEVGKTIVDFSKPRRKGMNNDKLNLEDLSFIRISPDDVGPNDMYITNFGAIPLRLIVDKREQILYDAKITNSDRVLAGWKFNEPYSKERYVAPGISHIPEPLESRTQYLARNAADPTSMKINIENFTPKDKHYEI